MTTAALRLRRARARYVRRPSARRLRHYLRLKASMGIWDDRFLIDADGQRKAGNVEAPARRCIMRAVAAGLVCTSTTGGGHAPGSHHYPRNNPGGTGRGRAVDVGANARERGTEKGRLRMIAFQVREVAAHRAELLECFGPDNARNVKNGAVIPLTEGTALETQHDTHVHLAFR